MFYRRSEHCQFHLKSGVRRRDCAWLPPPTPPAVGKCVSRTECPHGLTGYSSWATYESANSTEPWSGAPPIGKQNSEKGGNFVLLEWACWMSVVRNAHRQSYIIMRCGRGKGNLRERQEGKGGSYFPLHACSCPHQLEHFSQRFWRNRRLLYKERKDMETIISVLNLRTMPYQSQTWVRVFPALSISVIKIKAIKVNLQSCTLLQTSNNQWWHSCFISGQEKRRLCVCCHVIVYLLVHCVLCGGHTQGRQTPQTWVSSSYSDCVVRQEATKLPN